jgi:leucyl-tRNA synthetase
MRGRRGGTVGESIEPQRRRRRKATVDRTRGADTRTAPGRTDARGYDVLAVETRWQHLWERNECFRAPERPQGPRYFNYDSGPFPNGELHLGHVRTYALGDMTARYQRLLGKSVLYCTEWDSFGLPNELAALAAQVSPRELTRSCIRRIRSQLVRLGTSYDWTRVVDTSDPAYYRWTQWLFLKLLALGLVERQQAELPWCPTCETTLARMQVIEGACWRCGQQVERRRTRQWCVTLSRDSAELLRTLSGLDAWGARAKNLLHGFIAGDVHDWVVSRQRAWGTPIPIVHCGSCGAVPVEEAALPVMLPDDLDWSFGPRALAECATFVETPCPACGEAARRETDTLDCYFDDIWCFLAAAGGLGPAFAFDRGAFGWMPVDRFHSGYDTFFYLHLHRFLGLHLARLGVLDGAEPIRSYIGHDMVLAGGRKMSTHLGNAVGVGSLLLRHGADALRIAVLGAANPNQTVQFADAMLARAEAQLAAFHRLYAECARAMHRERVAPAAAVSRAALELRREADQELGRIGRYVDEYRPKAALDALERLVRQTSGWALRRVASERLSAADRFLLAGLLRDLAVALSPFAPHLAEESWRLVGGEPFVSLGRWPELAR